MSEALIFESVNPQYDDRLFIDSQLQYKKNTSWEHIVYKHCFEDQNKNKKQCLYTTCSEVVFFLYWSQESMNNLSSYCGLTDWRMSASDTNLPVPRRQYWNSYLYGWGRSQWRRRRFLIIFFNLSSTSAWTLCCTIWSLQFDEIFKLVFFKSTN